MAWQIILMLKQKDPSAPFTFNEIAQLPKEIQLPKHSTKTVECQLILPEKPFNGYVLEDSTLNKSQMNNLLTQKTAWPSIIVFLM